MNVIEIKNLTKYYGKSRGIVDVSFNVEEGKFLALLGLMGLVS
jgi:ABC-2 type transport system ATP-binding protein